MSRTSEPSREKGSPADPSGARLSYLRAWRNHRGFTQDELEEALVKANDARDPSERLAKPITRTQIARLETGKSGYSPDQAELLAEALDCSVGDLMFIDPADPKGSARRLVESSPTFREGLNQMLAESFSPFREKE